MEEFRIEKALIKLAKKMNKKMFIWSSSSGLYSPPDKPQKTIKDPLELINVIPGTEPSSIFILKDINPWFKDALVVRGLRDLISTLRNTYKTIIILSPELEIPVSLEKDITVIDYKLPNLKELGKLFDKTYNEGRFDELFFVDLPALAVKLPIKKRILCPNPGTVLIFLIKQFAPNEYLGK